MNHPSYVVVGIVTALVSLGVAIAVRRHWSRSPASPASYRVFGWLQASLGVFCIAAYHVSGEQSPDGIALGWALAVFGGYMVESGRLREKIAALEAKIDSLGGPVEVPSGGRG